jgi:hypothetical protein
MVGGEEPAVCVRCHTADKRVKGWQGARSIRASLDSLVASHSSADSLVRRAERAGMEVSDALYELNEAHGRLTKTRSFLHTFDPERVAQVAGEGMELAASARGRGQQALEDLAFRRRGLVASLAVIAVLAIALLAKIREIDRRQKSG